MSTTDAAAWRTPTPGTVYVEPWRRDDDGTLLYQATVTWGERTAHAEHHLPGEALRRVEAIARRQRVRMTGRLRWVL